MFKLIEEITFKKPLLLKTKFYLNIGKINTVEIIEHLVDLRRILKYSTSCLSQVIKRCVSSQSLGKGTYSGNLWRNLLFLNIVLRRLIVQIESLLSFQ